MEDVVAYRCPKCNRLHSRISQAEARAFAAAHPTVDRYEDYLQCGKCGTSSSLFLPATQADVETEGRRRRTVTVTLYDIVIGNPDCPA